MDHLDPETGLELLAALAPEARERAGHLLRCDLCRVRLLAALASREAESPQGNVPHAERVVPFEPMWRRQLGEAVRARGDREEEERQAETLYAELLPLAAEERLKRLELEPRFWTLALARLLLATAGEAKTPRQVKALVVAAEAIGSQLRPEIYGKPVLAELQADLYCVQAQADSQLGDTGSASLALDFAARALWEEPLDAPVRARLCLSSAVIHGDRGLLDLALALADRAVQLWARVQELGKVGEAYSVRGWLLLEHGHPEQALPALENAVRLLEPTRSPQAACRARGGLAMALAELGHQDEALRALDEAFSRLPAEAATTSLRRLEAAVLERVGQAAEAADRLAGILQERIEGESIYDLLMAGADLARLQVCRGQTQAAADTLQKTARMAESANLSPEVRAALAFLHRFAPGRETARDLLAEAAGYFDLARRLPDVAFDFGEPEIGNRDWEDLDLPTRSRLCEEAGLSAHLAQLAGTELDAHVRTLLRLTYKGLTQFYLSFERDSAAPS